MKPLLIFFIAMHSITAASAQEDTALHPLPSNYLTQVSSRSGELMGKLNKSSEKALAQLQKKEEKLKSKLSRVDSSKAKEIFGDAKTRYGALEEKLQNPSSLTQYIPYLDTLKTSLKFLENNKQLFSKAKDLDKSFSGAAGKLKSLESSFAKAEVVKAFIKERREYLRQQLQNLPFSKELKKLNKQAYYYSAQLSEYKETLKDKKNRERKVIELLSKTKQFQEFMQEHSQLASLFSMQGADQSNAATAFGLQTRASINQIIQDRIGSGADVRAMLTQNVQSSREQLSQLKEQIGKYSSASLGNSSSEMETPDFKPNEQKTKSLLKRLEYGGNVQSQKARMMFPITSDLGLSLGYKLNSKSILGVGASFKLGLGTGWNNVRLSNEGVGLRSFIDYKLKGSLFISGGYEQNYRTLFASLEQRRSYNSWQSSGLIGLSKKYSVSKKLKGSVQLLWDFLSYQQVPQTQALLFRVGYGIK